MPEDQVAKRGTTVQLECRVKHDPSLKLAVSWLKDDEPLYISNRSPLLPPQLRLSGPCLLPAPGDTWTHPGLPCPCVAAEPLKRVLGTSGERPPPVPALPLLSALLHSPFPPPLLPSFPPFSPLSICTLFSVLRPLLAPLWRPGQMPPASFQPSQQCCVPRQSVGLPEQALTLWLVGSPLLHPGPTPVLSLSQIWI